jgi:VWFA-related protein
MIWVFTSKPQTPGVCAGLFCMLGLLAGSLAAQRIPPSAELKKSVNLVEVPVVVRDRKGHAVTNLTRDDFAIYDNEKLQKIALFRYLQPSNGEHASERKLRHEIASANVSSSDGGSSGHSNTEEAEGSHLLIVIPQLQLASRSYALRALAKALQQHWLDNETVSIIDNSSQDLPFTSDRDSLVQAVKRLQSIKISPCQGGPWIAAARDQLLQMRSMTGRKFLLIFSDAALDPQCVTLGEFGFGNSPWALLRLALNSNVAIYPVDPRGVVPVVPGGDASTQAYFGPGEAAGGVVGQINGRLASESSALATQQSSLMQVAARTGGRAADGNDLTRAFRMMQEDSSYYELGYYLSDLQADGAYHSIRVRLRRRDLQVLAKEGYQAPIPFADLSRGQRREWLYRALLEDQPLQEIQLNTRSSAFFNPPSADTILRIAVQARWWVPKPEVHNRRWTMLVSVVQDERGTVVGHFENTNFWRPNDNPRETSGYLHQKAAYNILTQLKPGRYQIKMAVADLYTAVAGSCRLSFDVPEHAPPQPSASSVVLSEQWVTDMDGSQEHADSDESPVREVNQIMSVGLADPLRIENRHLVPSIDRVFAPDAHLSVFVRFYPKPEDHFPERWKVSANLRDSAGKPVISDAHVDIIKPTAGSSGIPILYAVDLSKLQLREGMYSAELEFSSVERKQALRVSGQFIIDTTEAGK